MRGATRREREKQQHRREVLRAAEAVFAERGYYDATVQEIAERAEFAVGTIYTMFDGKTAIYYELIEMRAREYMQNVHRAVEALSDPREQIRSVIATKLKFFEDNERFFQIFTRAISGGKAVKPFGLSEHGRRIYATYTRMLSEVFSRGIQQNLFVNVSPTLLVVAVEGVTNALIAHSVHTGGAKLADATPERIEQLLFHGILAEPNP